MDVDSGPVGSVNVQEETVRKESKNKKNKRKSVANSSAMEESVKVVADESKVADAEGSSNENKKRKSESDGGEKKNKKKKVSCVMWQYFGNVEYDAFV